LYLHTFEKLAEEYEWPKETWAMRLAALLAGKALEAYARMDRDESKEYIWFTLFQPSSYV
jgi:hypothetical protein